MGGTADLEAVPPPPPPPPYVATSRPAEILVCQAGACRNAGSDAVLLEIEELAKGIGSCTVDAVGCLGACSQAPNLLVVRGRKELVCTKVVDVEKSAAAVQQATGRRPNLDDPELLERLTRARRMRIRRRAREESKWNAALSGLAEQAARGAGAERLELQFELSQLLMSAGLWEEALERLNDVATFAPGSLEVLAERVKLLGKLGRREDLEAVEERVSRMRLDTYAAIELLSLLGKSKNDPAAKLEASERPIEKYGMWRLESVSKVSRHTAIYHLTSKDRMRGTPNPRGRGRTVWNKTWHTTLLAKVGDNGEGPLPWVERDYTPISTAKEWEQGKVDILVKVYATGLATSWLSQLPLGSPVLLSQPSKTLDVPSLVEDLTQAPWKPASVLLLLAGSGIVVAPQVLHHGDKATCFGPTAPLTQPVSLVYSCRRDDVCMAEELAAWCGAGKLQRCTLLLTEPQAEAPPPFPEMEAAPLADPPPGTGMKRVEGRLSCELLAAELAAAKEPCRVVVSGPAAFNAAAKRMLGQVGLPSEAVTVLSA